MHLSNVIPANDTRESVFGLRNFPRRERGSNLGPLAPEASALTTELPRFRLSIYLSYLLCILAEINADHYARECSFGNVEGKRKTKQIEKTLGCVL